MKIKSFSVVIMVLTCAVFKPVFAQSTITTLLKTKPVAPSNSLMNDDKLAEIRSYCYTFANGVKLIVRADTNSKVAQMRAISPGGASVFNDADFQSAIHAGAIIANSGLGDYNQAVLNTFFKQRQISLIPGIDENYSTLTGSFNANDLEAFLQAVYLYFTQPRKDKAAFNRYIKGLQANAALRGKNASDVLQDTVKELATGNKNRVDIPSDANIKNINLDRAYDIYRKCFGNARGFTFVITGNFEADEMNSPEKITDLLTQYLGSLPSTADSTTIIDRNTEIPHGKIYKTIYDGHNAMANVRIIYSGTFHYADSVNLQLKALSYLLEKRLNALSTFGGANKAMVKLVLNKFPKETYAVNIAFKCQPLQANKMMEMVHKTITSLQHGIKPEEIAQYITAKSSELKEQTYHDNLFWAGYLLWQAINHEDPEEIAQYPYNFHNADEHTVQQAANQYLTGENYLQAVVLPRKNK